MTDGIIGKKLGMTQIFHEEGGIVPVTVVQAGPCKVVQVKTVQRDHYGAVQLGFEEKDKKLIFYPKDFDKVDINPRERTDMVEVKWR